MKRFFALSLCWMTCSAAWGQGTVFFYNHVLGTNSTVVVDAPVTDGVGGAKIDGTNLPSARVELYAGPVGTTENNLLAVGPAVGFRSGAAAGYFDSGADGSRTIPGVLAGSNAVVQVRAWAGAATYETALTTAGAKLGRSAVLTVVTGGQTNSGIATLPANLVGLQGFAIAPVGGTPTFTLGIQFQTNAVLTLTAPAGHAYQIQYSDAVASTNQWQLLASFTLSGGGTNVIDPQSTNATRRFYRALQTQ
ncbi:MAG: hypothetical protein ACYDH9_23240 [Limisphaerales bacterium]